ncbi:MAG: hypothetical protein KGQ48_10955 [Bradyrhizobium sp.]|nr:hypothetical protein [Bradyrhizobium sp.]
MFSERTLRMDIWRLDRLAQVDLKIDLRLKSPRHGRDAATKRRDVRDG